MRALIPYPLSGSRGPEGVAVVGQTVAGRAALTAWEAAARGARRASRHPLRRAPAPSQTAPAQARREGPRRGPSSALPALLQARSGRGALGWRRQQRRRRGGEGVQDAARGGPVPSCPDTAAAAAAGTGPGPGAAARAAIAAAAAAAAGGAA